MGQRLSIRHAIFKASHNLKVENPISPRLMDRYPYKMISPKRNQKLILAVFFHGNGNDTKNCPTYIQKIADETGMTIVVPEYATYGEYWIENGDRLSADQLIQRVQEDSLAFVSALQEMIPENT